MSTKSPVEMMLDGLTWTRVKLPPPEERTSGLPVATHEGVLNLGGASLRVYQLSNGQRVFDADDLAEFFGGKVVAP